MTDGRGVGDALVGAVLVGAVLLVAGCSDDGGTSSATSAAPATTVSPLPPGAVAVFDLEVGQCFDGLTEGRSAAVTVVRCRRPHQGEVYGLVTFRGRRFPGRAALLADAETRCTAAYEDYTGEPVDITTAAAFTELLPTRETWADGDRTGVCLALGPEGGRLTGSIAGGDVV